MISSIFGKTKPINFIILTSYLFSYLLLSQYLLLNTEITLDTLANQLLIFIALVFTVFLINFIDRKNNLSKNNAYIILLFSLWISFFPQLFQDKSIIFAHIFLLLAVRRLLRLKDGLAITQKIFDASFWICIATLFYSWSIAYMVLVYAAIVLYNTRNYRTWLIPFTAMASIVILRYAWLLWFTANTGLFSGFQFTIQLEHLEYTPTNNFLPLVFLSVMGIFAVFAHTANVMRKKAKKDPAVYVMMAAMVLGAIMILFLGNENKTTFIFIVFPVAVLVTNALERMERKRLKEAYLWLLFLMPVALLIVRYSILKIV